MSVNGWERMERTGEGEGREGEGGTIIRMTGAAVGGVECKREGGKVSQCQCQLPRKIGKIKSEKKKKMEIAKMKMNY